MSPIGPGLMATPAGMPVDKNMISTQLKLRRPRRLAGLGAIQFPHALKEFS